MAFRSRAKPKARGGWFFRTKQPHHVTWLIALAVAVVGILGTRIHIDYVSPNAIWVILTAYIVLALGTVIDGL